MVALTYGDARATSVDTATKAVGPAETAAPRQSWLARFFDAMMQARLHQAQREIRFYARMIPPAQMTDGSAPSEKVDSTGAPFGGW